MNNLQTEKEINLNILYEGEIIDSCLEKNNVSLSPELSHIIKKDNVAMFKEIILNCYENPNDYMQSLILKSIIKNKADKCLEFIGKYCSNYDLSIEMENDEIYPIFYCARFGNLEIMKQLIYYGANPNVINCCNESVLHWIAKYSSDLDMFKFCAKLYTCRINYKNINGDTIEDILIKQNKIAWVKYIDCLKFR